MVSCLKREYEGRCHTCFWWIHLSHIPNDSSKDSTHTHTHTGKATLRLNSVALVVSKAANSKRLETWDAKLYFMVSQCGETSCKSFYLGPCRPPKIMEEGGPCGSFLENLPVGWSAEMCQKCFPNITLAKTHSLPLKISRATNGTCLLTIHFHGLIFNYGGAPNDSDSSIPSSNPEKTLSYPEKTLSLKNILGLLLR